MGAGSVLCDLSDRHFDGCVSKCVVVAWLGVEVTDISAHVGVHGKSEADGVRQSFAGRHRPCDEWRLRVPDGVDNDRLQRTTQL